MSTSITTPQRAMENGAIDENDSNIVVEAPETSTPDVSTPPDQPPATTTKSATATTTALPSAVEFEPPLACIRRILKNALPSSTNVGKDASAAFARASGIFIIYLTACANDFARENKRQTITANDVLAAIKELDFDEFTPDMLAFLESYRQSEKSKKNAKAAVAAAATAKSSSSKDEVTPTEEDDEDDDDEEEEEDDGELVNRKRTSVDDVDNDKVNDQNDDETDVEDENDMEDEPSTKRMKTTETNDDTNEEGKEAVGQPHDDEE